MGRETIELMKEQFFNGNTIVFGGVEVENNNNVCINDGGCIVKTLEKLFECKRIINKYIVLENKVARAERAHNPCIPR